MSAATTAHMRALARRAAARLDHPLPRFDLLARTASCYRKVLRACIALSEVIKDGVTYKDAFDGQQAVDKIAYTIETMDRNLALLLGHALGAQKYFHAFRTRVPSLFVSGELSPPGGASPGDGSMPAATAATVRPDPDRGSPSNEASAESE
ncbi:hypothetical protein BC834DRAFT_966336 [Gloeopeniophorella convolvens]|nr:hypothetical protein BC834DRAFT_966336 [Gloeopeniophorella convolvens]